MTTHEHAGHHGPTGTDEATVHRWVVFGTDRIYLSHLSMFSMPEHAMQVIVEAEFAKPDGSPSTAYSDDRQSHPKQRLYTLDPELFVLSDILPTGSRPPRQEALQTDLYRDHVEKNNPERERIAKGIEARIRQAVLANSYDPNAAPLSNLEYVVFGDADELYLAHFITRPPDFDQIIRVTVKGEITTDALSGGIRLTVPERANTLKDRLKEGDKAVSAIVHGGNGDVTVEVKPEVEFYCNSDRDLQ